jgi:hypothetical protein
VKWVIRATLDKFDAADAAEVTQRAFRRLGILPFPDSVLPADQLVQAGLRPYETLELAGNLLTTAGLGRLTSLLIAGGGQGLTNTATRLGTGNGAGTAAVGDTDLSASAGSTNRWFQVMDATYPQQAAGVLTVKSTFASADGNYTWNEWGIDVGTPTVSSSALVAALLFNHKTSAALGPKTSAGVWAFTATATIV